MDLACEAWLFNAYEEFNNNLITLPCAFARLRLKINVGKVFENDILTVCPGSSDPT